MLCSRLSRHNEACWVDLDTIFFYCDSGRTMTVLQDQLMRIRIVDSDVQRTQQCKLVCITLSSAQNLSNPPGACCTMLCSLEVPLELL